MAETSPEMRLFSPEGERLYLSADERERFLKAALEEERENRLFCAVLHYTGARPSEALDLTPERISLSDGTLTFKTLKKRKKDSEGRLKQPKFRTIPVPDKLIDELDLVFDLRRIDRTGKATNSPLWTISRSTAWRIVKRVMDRAGITGKQATSKGLRHGFGIAMLAGNKPLPLNILRDLMGHTDTKTTEIYLQAIGSEKRQLVMQAWE
ncbi:tyrosine-type recombinase/integrase [Methylophaga nitratireducenticrescens]|uniref:tyrosine-type recombinase/integrase n=1 Tax=Methylophaga nitratireducenticrescens TaxID=754476 RepID=UPI000CDC7DEE|nr:tyrosine-type recombinase/integrase [Methylophaga nitratireducenticrescens]AUZ86175.1 integrase [Methylophaga nitratireducenticrescens]